MATSELYSKLDLQLMNVKQLRDLLKKNSLKIPKLKADMINTLLENKIGHTQIGLENLPNEKIFEICETLDDVSLAKFVQTEKRVNEVCKDLLGERKDTYLNERKSKLIEWILEQMNFDDFERGIEVNGPDEGFMGFRSYEGFESSNRSKVMSLDEEKLKFYEKIRSELIPNTDLMDKETVVPWEASGFCFSWNGRLIIFHER